MEDLMLPLFLFAMADKRWICFFCNERMFSKPDEEITIYVNYGTSNWHEKAQDELAAPDQSEEKKSDDEDK